jgi:hypothetical protein
MGKRARCWRRCSDILAWLQIVPAPHTLAFHRTIIEMIAGGHIGEMIAIDARIATARNYPDGSAPQH